MIHSPLNQVQKIFYEAHYEIMTAFHPFFYQLPSHHAEKSTCTFQTARRRETRRLYFKNLSACFSHHKRVLSDKLLIREQLMLLKESKTKYLL